MTVQEIADMLETEGLCKDFDNDDVDRVFIEPPENIDESHEDLGDKSGTLLYNLSADGLTYSPNSRVSPDIRYAVTCSEVLCKLNVSYHQHV